MIIHLIACLLITLSYLVTDIITGNCVQMISVSLVRAQQPPKDIIYIYYTLRAVLTVLTDPD